MRWSGRAKGAQLFDMKKDPGQYTNLVNNPAHKKTVARLKAKLKAKLKAVRDNDLGLKY